MKMQIVIDIDEDLYKSIIGHRCKTRFQQRCDYEDLKNAIEDGTLLPKHGRLIDDVLDKIRDEIDVARFVDKDTKLCKNANASGLEVAMQIIDKYRVESGVEE